MRDAQIRSSNGDPSSGRSGDEQGVSLRGIARRLGMHRATVRHWLGAGSFPERARRVVAPRTDAFLDYLRRRWDEGCHNAAQLTREIRACWGRPTSVSVGLGPRYCAGPIPRPKGSMVYRLEHRYIRFALSHVGIT